MKICKINILRRVGMNNIFHKLLATNYQSLEISIILIDSYCVKPHLGIRFITQWTAGHRLILKVIFIMVANFRSQSTASVIFCSQSNGWIFYRSFNNVCLSMLFSQQSVYVVFRLFICTLVRSVWYIIVRIITVINKLMKCMLEAWI